MVTTRRVLIVDDNEDITALLRLHVERSDDLEVAGSAGDGATAITMARVERPDVILLDMMMPGMSGLEALPILRGMLPDCRIIMFSAASYTDDKERAIELGADEYHVKGEAFALLDTLTSVEVAS